MESQVHSPRSRREYELQRDRLQAEINKLVAERRKLDKESDWYPFAAGVAFAGAMLAVGKHLFG
jgi:hypothetical protein